ncbi:transcriptional regulator, AraC family [Clostridium sp. DL-VIII]|uniref:AraC family transcriptional regulator n=1 Tax=Clostridium sp. DL-VIII TaxID=641107 RepID=UPI00023AF55E|nr:AraC family transcriptional regulator [Clostridium sp. DL-VIII]EHI97289.1 transcriptional regulator, AraC family [Clostridium sp. DL-VIII]
MNIYSEYSIPESDNTQRLLQAKITRLAHLLYTYAPQDGVLNLPISGLSIIRYSGTEMNCPKTFYLPSLSIIAQGARSITIGHETYQLDKSQMIMNPITLPISIQTMKVTKSEPLLIIRLDLNPERISEIVPKIYPNGLPQMKPWNAGHVMNTDISIIDAMIRLLECLQKPGDVEFIVPLIMDEILIRLLRSSVGVHVAAMGFTDSGVHQVAEAIAWLRNNFSQSVKVSDLAKLTHMSVSSFYNHFKAVTSMSPTQYQKALRLHEARHLMLSKHMDATTASRMTGYVSNSQFSRDYSNFYGAPPRKYIDRLHQQPQKAY